MAKDIKIRVKAEDQASGPLNKVSGNINSLSKKINSAAQPLNNLGKSLSGLTKSIPGIGLVAASIAGVTKAVKETVKSMKEWEASWGEVEKSIKRIDFAAKINQELGASSRELQNFTSNLSDALKNTVSGGELNEVVAQLGFDKTAEQIKQILTVATDLSAAMGTDLNTAVSQLNSTFTGTVGQLRKMFPELKNLSKESLEAGEAVALVAEKVKGMAKEMTDSVNGSLLRSKNLTNDLKEEFGYYMKDFFNPIRDQISDIKEKWRDALAAKRTVEEAQAARKAHRASVADYDILINALQEEVAGNTAFAKQTGGVAAQGAYNKNQELLTQIITLNKERSEVIAELNNLKYKQSISAAMSTTSDTSTSAVTTVSKEDPLAKIKAQILANAKAMQEYTDHIHEQSDYYVETMIAYKKARKAEIEAQKQAAAAKWSTYGGEVGGLVAGAMTGGIGGVMTQLLSSLIQKMQEQSGIITALFNGVSTFMDIAIKPLVQLIEPLVNPLLGFIQGQGAMLGGLISLLQPFTDIVTPILELIGKIMFWVQTFLTNLIDYIKYGYTEVYNWFIKIYNAIVSKRKEKNERDQTKSLDEINKSMKGLFNGDFLDAYKAMLESNYGLSPASSASGSATYNAVRDINVYINFDRSFVNGDAMEIAVELERQIQKAYRMNLI